MCWDETTTLRDPNALGRLSATSLLTLTVTKPPGDKQGFLLQVTFVVIAALCASKSFATSPAAEFAARIPLASLLETTNARVAVRAETSVDKYALATLMLELAIIESGTNRATVIPINSTITFPLSALILITMRPHRLHEHDQSLKLHDPKVESLSFATPKLICKLGLDFEPQ